MTDNVKDWWDNVLTAICKQDLTRVLQVDLDSLCAMLSEQEKLLIGPRTEVRVETYQPIFPGQTWKRAQLSLINPQGLIFTTNRMYGK